jgi:hypothetical protein
LLGDLIRQAAIKTLALVRKLALPALQLNIANKQQIKNA